MRALCVLLLLAGCDRLLGLQHLPETTNDGSPSTDVASGTDDGAMTTDAPADGVAAVCPPGYTPDARGNMYRLVMTSATWNAAHTDCANDSTSSVLHTHLVVLDDENERESVLTYASTAVWIGLRDRFMQEEYAWVTNQDTGGYPGGVDTGPWAPGEPTGGDEDCVFEGSSGLLFDEPCASSQLWYVCECDAYPQVF